MVADLDATAEAISERGIEPTELEDYGEARKFVFHDPDGNEIGIGQVPKAQAGPTVPRRGPSIPQV
jgi:predicted enzyme related to lactoylglutathione lyase